MRIGIIGAGIARTTQFPVSRIVMGARIVAASKNPKHAAAVAKQFEIERVANNWRDLMSRKNVDLVSVVTHLGHIRK